MRHFKDQQYNKTYFIYRWQKKADAVEYALTRGGWGRSGNPRYTSAAFFDTDILERVDLFDRLSSQGVKMFVYPHAARPNIVYGWKDVQPHPRTTAHFVTTEEHGSIMRLLGYPHNIHAVGWMYCPLAPFRPSAEVKNVLFGPIHPNSNGWLHDVDKTTNREALKRLKEASKEMGFKLTIRHIHSLEENGLPTEYDPEITYVQGKKDNGYSHIDAADMVVGTQTFAYIAVARGRPTLMMDEWVPPKAGNNEQAFAYIRDWGKIKDLMMYPLDLNTTGDVSALIKRAASTDADVREWRQRMIGPQFSPGKFVKSLESYFG
jgi:hypothetical protein